MHHGCRWKRKHCKAGGQGGAVYAYIKRTEDTPDIITRCLGTRDASPQAVVDEDFKFWNALWSKLEAFAETPWRTDPEPDVGDPLPPLRHKEIRTAAASFKVSTGSGIDAMLPLQFTWLSDELLDCIGIFFEHVERFWKLAHASRYIHSTPNSQTDRRKEAYRSPRLHSSFVGTGEETHNERLA